MKLKPQGVFPMELKPQWDPNETETSVGVLLKLKQW